MSLCRYLPTPSDRMGVLWTLLSVKDAVVLEYGPAGTTHFSVGFFGKLGVEPNQTLFTTHLSEDDIIMGDVTRLEEAIREIDKNYHPKVIFVVSSAVISVIGTDIKGVCTYMKEEVNARLIPVDTGGFKGDYSLGIKEAYSLLTRSFVTKETEVRPNSYNILGASGYSYRMKADLWEMKELLSEAFQSECNAVLGMDSSTEQLERLGAASVNLVLKAEALPAAIYLQETFGTPYIYDIPYGYTGTKQWLEQISAVLSTPVAPALMQKLQLRMMQSAGYKMYAAMYADREHAPNAVLIGDYDQLRGFSRLFAEIGLPVSLKFAAHSLAGLEADDIVKPKTEKEKIDYLKELTYSLVLGDEISLYLCDSSCEKLLTAFPLVHQSQIAEHLPFVGIRGMDYILEAVDRYFSRM
ncbi:MAG: nitrogenase component 1 [Lachnospiraceae bacterium]|nr:nitrogenase component 1 [Lachnospiraceae bacterium]